MASGIRNIGIHLDVGHDSIGWCVTEKLSKVEFPVLPGAGVVLFPPDDCLANERRNFRRQRRHIRATRQRIARMKELLLQMGVLTREELDKNRTASPWKLAAAVLTSGKLLAWQELWCVLRWYAHNRGYDGNKLASARAGRLVDAEDREQNEKANALMEQCGTTTMAETMCKVMDVDPNGRKSSSRIYFKGNKVAFDRSVVVNEVVRILRTHKGVLKGVDDYFIKLLTADPLAESNFLVKADGLPFRVQNRYWGGVLFGQLAPRFDNRIIGKCPIDGKKLPNKASKEFCAFRWAMILSNIRVGKEARRLTVAELKTLDEAANEVGGFTEGDFKKLVKEVVKSDENNMESLLSTPEAGRSLVKLPGRFALKKAGVLNVLSESDDKWVRKLSCILFKGKSLTLRKIADAVGGETGARIAALAKPENQPKRGKKKSTEVKINEKIAAEFQSGRAPYSRETMMLAVKEVFEGKHPFEKGGSLYRNAVETDPLPENKIDQATNNHLVRHRVKIVLRLIKDIVHDYAEDNPERVSQVTIETARDMKDMSGKKNKEIVKDLLRRTQQHRDAVKYIAEKFNVDERQVPPGLIRKVRIAMDMNWTCPYTGRKYDIFDISSRNMREAGIIDKDHILPRSQRATDSLDSLTLTFRTVNDKKKNMTGLEFVRKFAGQPVAVSGGNNKNAQIVTEAMYRKIVDDLKLSGHSDDRARQKRRKLNFLRKSVDEVGMTDGMLTRTSHITTLASRAIKGYFGECKKPPQIVSIPGRVTAFLRNQWNLLGVLAEIDARICDEHGLKLKQEIRGITHMHHAVDAITLGLAATLLPIDGAFYAMMCKRRVTSVEREALDATGIFRFSAHNEPQLVELPKELRSSVYDALAEQRVVVHMPQERDGLKVEQLTWGVDRVEDGVVYIHQRSRDEKTGKIKHKTDKIPESKAFGLHPIGGTGKLQAIKGVLQASNNFGVVLSENPVIIRHCKVWDAVGCTRDGKPIVRLGGLIRVEDLSKKHDGLWRVASVKGNKTGPAFDLVRPYATKAINKVDEAWINVDIRALVRKGVTAVNASYTGVPCPITSSTSQRRGRVSQ